eukprot:TRINITY_DN27547_c0_g1_i1.p1 TRINITY_DN27547_c0_g1~~TRINITY_DN27547_c0_g1_i1.p1  ORF type:complete len:342 (+),score=51.26 TRINITY_DN27547_c0_g1_i1:44-1027(+)
MATIGLTMAVTTNVVVSPRCSTIKRNCACRTASIPGCVLETSWKCLRLRTVKNRSTFRSSRRMRPVVFADLSSVADVAPLLEFALPTTLLAAFVAVRAVVYFRAQYITAAMLGRHVPRGGARVLDLNLGGGKNLYYVPKDVIQVVGVRPQGKNPLMLENVALQAGVPVDVRTCGPEKLDIPSNSMDAVISVHGLSPLSGRMLTAVVAEASRVLKPGKPLVFVEAAVADASWLRACQLAWWKLVAALGRGSPFQGADVVEALKASKCFDVVDFERVLEFQDPHVVGVAILNASATSNDSPAMSSPSSQRKKVSSSSPTGFGQGKRREK